ncbi:alpha-galactosidase [Streptococcus marmotae]|uniref:alpha-galactosidase n=1 Tax=Streptococcus marmotae TaxID=1825069 RepID=UPI000831226A|nr:alpha-galactosidase [Streptococcus marmotae]
MKVSVSDSQYFHLQTKNTSYIFRVLENGGLGHVYYGKKIPIKDSYPYLTVVEERGFEPYTDVENTSSQPNLMRFEYSSYGRGDFRQPAYQIALENGSRISDLIFDSYQLLPGKSRLEGLPATFASDEFAITLVIKMVDPTIGLTVYLSYTIFKNQDVIARSVQFKNDSQQKMKLLRTMSLQVDLRASDYDFIHFSGAWLRERYVQRTPLRYGLQSVDSLRVSSSPQQNPFIMLASKETTEDSGAVYGFNLIYSGNHLEQIEVDHFGCARVLVGMNPFDFSWTLLPGETFQTPEALQCYTSNGFNSLSQLLANFYHEHLINPVFSKKDRPLLINSWEATYFDISTKKIKDLADKAKDLGIELVVIDDGWYGHRDNDQTSLGDWVDDQTKFPEGIAHIANYVHSIGLKFGLWFEPEMISEDSDLYRSHPDWRIAAPNRQPCLGRQQFVLDFSRKEVVDNLFSQMKKMIKETGLDYIKWDMNRHITDLYSLALENNRQQEFAHRYILGVYELYDRLIKAFPNILFESCASGGGRFDLGMMYYAPQAWTSDNTDPIERLKIQYGTSYGYPLSMMTGHVSASPNHQTGRVTTLTYREHVSYFSVLGYEFDLTQLDKEAYEQIKEGITFYKTYRHLFQYGTFYRILSPFTQNIVSWQVVSQDKTCSILARYQILSEANPAPAHLIFKGLDRHKYYQIKGYDDVFTGEELMNAGVCLPLSPYAGERVVSVPDFKSWLFILNEYTAL